ncbi:hypothetical protein BLA29_007018, partial [Euroglyphus maynei]
MHCSRLLSKIYSICLGFTEDKWIKYRYMIAVGSKILDVYIVDMVARSETFSSDHGKMFLTNLDPFSFCILRNNVTMSELYRKFLENYGKIIDNHVVHQYKWSIIHRQMMAVFTATDENKMDFETAILNELLNRIIKSHEQYDDDTFKLIVRVTEEMCNHYNNIDNI